MTITDETTTVGTTDDTGDGTDETTTETTDESGKRKREHDFSKFRDFHQEVADYVNAHSGLDPLTPNQIKAVLLLRTDFANTPEQVAAREERKAQVAKEKAEFEGLTEDQKKAKKAVKKAQEQADRFAKKAQEAMERANKLRTESEGSGADLAAAVEAQQNGTDPEAEPEKRRGLGRRNR